MRPTYRCRTCAAHWPCPTARLVLTRLYQDDPAGLRRHLTAHLRHARRDLAETAPGVDAAALTVRFLGWLSPDGGAVPPDDGRGSADDP
ncbi:flavin reductase [Plantactinospora sonchi]|uniref:Flavin reductase n=2 Tax=Plantactinospora sonchi TaxID=1544735 RepID=A0ABU7RKQ7_9ACTN